MTAHPRFPSRPLARLARPALWLVACMLLPRLTLAVNGTSTNGLSLSLLTPERASFSRADCSATSGTEISFQWTFGNSILDGDQIALFIANDANCGSTTLSLRSASALSVQQGSFPIETDLPVKASDLFSAVSFGQGACTDPGVRQTVFVCATITNPNVTSGGFGASSRAIASAPILLNSKLPLAPVNLGLTALDSKVVVSWNIAPAETEAIASFNVVATPAVGNPVLATAQASAPSVTLSNLTNGVRYQIAVTAVDDAGRTGNEGPPLTGYITPLLSEDFLQRYKSAGGDETGGCSSGTAGIMALLVAALLLLRRSRRAPLVGALVAVLLPAISQAQSRPLCEEWCLSLQVDGGPYKPAVDSEPGLTGSPYSSIFGNASPWMSRLTLGAGLRTVAGTFGLGFAAGYWSVSGKARSADERNIQTEDKVSLSLSSVSPLLFWRGQFFYDRWHVPLVPFGQVGYGFVSWLSEKNSAISSAPGAKGDGWGRGLEWSAGVMVPINSLDEAGAANFFQTYGISTTSIFLAYSDTRWRGAHGLVLGGQGLTFGLVVMR